MLKSVSQEDFAKLVDILTKSNLKKVEIATTSQGSFQNFPKDTLNDLQKQMLADKCPQIIFDIELPTPNPNTPGAAYAAQAGTAAASREVERQRSRPK